MLDLILFGKRLRRLRKQAGEKQSDLAERLGITASQISEMEKSRKGTNLERFATICEYYSVSADYLLGFTEDPTPWGRDSGET